MTRPVGRWMARKAWSDLSPAYRARLERGGVTPASHEAGAGLARARGHGQFTPATRAHTEHVRASRGQPVERSAFELMVAERRIGRVPADVVAVAIGTYGDAVVSAALEWQTERKAAEAEGFVKSGEFTLQSFGDWARANYPEWAAEMEAEYGEDFWTEFDEGPWGWY